MQHKSHAIDTYTHEVTFTPSEVADILRREAISKYSIPRVILSSVQLETPQDGDEFGAKITFLSSGVGV
jgi:hypothetical protein